MAGGPGLRAFHGIRCGVAGWAAGLLAMGLADGALAQDPDGLGPTPPTGAPTDAAQPSAENCAPFEFSAELDLCYESETGYVFDANLDSWALPPRVEWCGVDARNPQGYFWWPALPACYDPTSGYAWSEQLGQWVFVGTHFERRTPSGDSGCSLARPAPAGRIAGPLGFIALVGVFVGARARIGARRGLSSRS